MSKSKKRIFISYKRNVVLDEGVALQVYAALYQQHTVFIDQNMPIGTAWATRIEQELRESDVLIIFLSEHSIHSEMVERELATAHHLAKVQGHPVILPVRLNYESPFPYPLSAYLNHINWAIWRDVSDTRRLIVELEQAIMGGTLRSLKIEPGYSSTLPDMPQPTPSAQPLDLELPEGTMDPQSQFYVVRPSDSLALSAIKRQGVTITIKGPRQMGKSSLLIRTIAEAESVGKRVVLLDFQLIDRSTLTNPDLFFRQFCIWLTAELELIDRTDDYWTPGLGNSQRCTRYLSLYLLKELGGPLVLAMDEVEAIFDTPFRSDFFAMLRHWHNQRATKPLWKQLDLALITSTEPYQLIANLNQSPFNVGVVLDLLDFDSTQVAELNTLHGNKLTASELDHLMALLGGHPYLVRRALYLVTSQQISPSDLFSQASAERGPFGDHLRYHLFRLHDKPELIRGLLQVLRQNTCESEEIFFRLRGAGLVQREGKAVLPRCQLYAAYFKEHLHD